MQIKRALISVSNKEGVVEFARQLHEAVSANRAGRMAEPEVQAILKDLLPYEE